MQESVLGVLIMYGTCMSMTEQWPPQDFPHLPHSLLPAPCLRGAGRRGGA